MSHKFYYHKRAFIIFPYHRLINSEEISFKVYFFTFSQSFLSFLFLASRKFFFKYFLNFSHTAVVERGLVVGAATVDGSQVTSGRDSRDFVEDIERIAGELQSK